MLLGYDRAVSRYYTTVEIYMVAKCMDIEIFEGSFLCPVGVQNNMICDGGVELPFIHNISLK